MNSGKVKRSYSYLHLQDFETGLFHYFRGKWFNDCKSKDFKSLDSQTKVFFYYYELSEGKTFP